MIDAKCYLLMTVPSCQTLVVEGGVTPTSNVSKSIEKPHGVRDKKYCLLTSLCVFNLQF